MVDDELEEVEEIELEIVVELEVEVVGVLLVLEVVEVEVVWVEDCAGLDNEYATAMAAMTMTRARKTTAIVLLTPDLSLEEYTRTHD